MAIWMESFTVDDLNAASRHTMAEYCGMRFTGFGDGWLEGTVPFDSHTEGMAGVLHPGALAMLAETLGSVAANLCVDRSARVCLGQTLSVNHTEPIGSGPISAKASVVAILNRSQIWDIEITDAGGAKVCVACLTVAVIERAIEPGRS